MQNIHGFQKLKRNKWVKNLLWTIKEFFRNHFRYYQVLNPSIIDHRGRRLIAFRDYVPIKSKIRIGELIGSRIRNVKTILGVENDWGAEDPRFFLFKGELFLSFVKTTWNRRAANDNYAKVGICKVNDDLSVSDLRVFAEFEGMQKNWLFFEALDTRLYAVVYSDRQQILDVDRNILIENDLQLEWPSEGLGVGGKVVVGKIRGGSTPVVRDGEYFSFFHVTPLYKGTENRSSSLCYEMGCYSFDVNAPFRITAYTPEGLLAGNPYIIPNGAILQDDEWTVSCGLNDSSWMLYRIRHADLIKKMVRVP